MKLPKKTKPNPQSEAKVLAQCRRALDSHPEVVMHERRTVGTLKGKTGQTVTVGVKGRADLWAVLTDGRHVEIEVKRGDGKGKLRKEQQDFLAFCNQHGILHIVVSDALTLFNWLTEISSDA